MAQKLGEEAVETLIEAIDGNDERLYEASDMLYHLMVLDLKGYRLKTWPVTEKDINKMEDTILIHFDKVDICLKILSYSRR